MTFWTEYALTLIAQVTAICFVALMLAAGYSRSPARRHAVGVLGLTLILRIPLIAPALPQAKWWRSAFAGSLPRRTSDDMAFRSTSTTSEMPESAITEPKCLTMSRASMSGVASFAKLMASALP